MDLVIYCICSSLFLVVSSDIITEKRFLIEMENNLIIGCVLCWITGVIVYRCNGSIIILSTIILIRNIISFILTIYLLYHHEIIWFFLQLIIFGVLLITDRLIIDIYRGNFKWLFRIQVIYCNLSIQYGSVLSWHLILIFKPTAEYYTG